MSDSTVAVIPEMFKASDGEKFKTLEEAEAHQVLIDAIKEVEETLRRVGRRVAESQKTADGKAFTFSHWSYYYIQGGIWNKPTLGEVSFSLWTCRVSIDRSRGIEIIGSDEKDTRTYRVSELYADRRKANLALIADQERWLSEQLADLAETKKAMGIAEPSPEG